MFLRVGEKSERAEAHDFASFLTDWKKLLTERGAHVQGGTKFPTKAQLGKTDVLVLYSGAEDTLSPTDKSNLEGFLKKRFGVMSS